MNDTMRKIIPVNPTAEEWRTIRNECVDLQMAITRYVEALAMPGSQYSPEATSRQIARVVGELTVVGNPYIATKPIAEMTQNWNRCTALLLARSQETTTNPDIPA